VTSERSYHILVLIADGQVTSEEDTIRAIVRASSFPLSIVMIGVGDGPWEMMHRFDDELPQRKFDNFQFVCFNELKQKTTGLNTGQEDAYFAMAMLMEIPEQYKAIMKLGLISQI